MALALSFAIIRRVPRTTYAEGVAIIGARSATLNYPVTALSTLRHWINAYEVRRSGCRMIPGDSSLYYVVGTIARAAGRQIAHFAYACRCRSLDAHTFIDNVCIRVSLTLFWLK